MMAQPWDLCISCGGVMRPVNLEVVVCDTCGHHDRRE